MTRHHLHSFPATCALAALLASGVLVATHGTAWPHSWYSTTKDPETGMGCCGGKDCKAVPKDSIVIDKEAGGYRYLPTGEVIPWSRAQQSHDFEFHRCEYLYDFTNSQGFFKKGDTRCFFVPGGDGVMLLDFIPRVQLVDRLKAGWRLIPGHEYSPDEWAILMMMPEVPEPISIYETMKVFQRPPAAETSPRICSVEECGQRTHGHGLCQHHYNRSSHRPKRGTAFVNRKIAEMMST